MGKQRVAVEKKGGKEQQVRDNRLHFEGQAAEHQGGSKTKSRGKIADTPYRAET